jgi:glycosyltransferase involved in cell wall biosynthesis
MLDRYLYTMPDKFITISESVKRMLLERGAKAEISVIPNGIELNHCNGNRTKMRRAYGFSEGEYIAGVVGRIAFRQKAQDFLINAIASYKEQLEDVRFCVIGDGPDEQKLRGMIRDAKLDDRVRMLPWNSDLSSFYSALDLLIIPSRFEGVPLVMLEAMWHEVPVVASNVDGMAEVLPSEWLFQCENPESLVSVLLRVRSADNSRLLAANKKTVSEQFSMSRFQNSFHSVVADKFREPVQPAWVTSAAQTPGSSLAHRN